MFQTADIERYEELTAHQHHLQRKSKYLILKPTKPACGPAGNNKSYMIIKTGKYNTKTLTPCSALQPKLRLY
jgi:hypothetical protein